MPVYDGTIVFDALSAVTTTLNGAPFVTLAGALTLKCVAGAGFTVRFAEPLIEPSPASIDCDPFDVNVNENVVVPLSPGTNV